MSTRFYAKIKGPEDSKRATRKGREFSAELIGLVLAGRTMPCQWQDTSLRPAFAAFAAGDAEADAFLANLQSGEEVVLSSTFSGSMTDRIEFLPSCGYAWNRQRSDHGTIITAHLPSRFAFDPGMASSTGAALVAMPSKEWAKRQRAMLSRDEMDAAIAHVMRAIDDDSRELDAFVREEHESLREALREMIPTALLFVAMLDRRCTVPLLSDLAFGLQVFIAMHARKGSAGNHLAGSRLTRFLSEPHGSGHPRVWFEFGMNELSFSHGAWLAAMQEHITRVITQETARYHALTRSGTRRVGAARVARRAHRVA